MTPRPKLSRTKSLATLLVLGLLAACTDQSPPPPSYVAEELARADFSPPPLQPDSSVTAEDLDVPQESFGAGKQIYLGSDQVVGNSARARAERTGGGVEINFENASIGDVAKLILGNALGSSYSIDPGVQGSVTINSGGPLDDRQLISVLESVLEMNDAALIENGAGYKIIPMELARGPGEVVSLFGGDSEVRPGFGSTIIPLRYISASAAAQFARSLVARPDEVQFDDRLSLISIMGSTAERQNVVDTIRDIDVNWLAGKSVGIFPLSVTTPEAMIPELETLFDSGEDLTGGIAATTIDFIPIARLNAVLAIAGQPEQIVQVDRWVSRLDKGKTVGMQFYVYTLKHLPAKDAAEILTEGFSGLPTVREVRLDQQLSADSALPPFTVDQELGLPDVTGDLAPLAVGPGSVGAGSSGTGMSGDVKIVANKANNSLLIRASPQNYELIEPTLRRLDRAPLQVLIEATIAEVTLNDQLRYGVQYFIDSGNVTAGFDNTNAAASATAALINPLTQLPGFNFLWTPGSSRILIDALASLTDVRVLSSPSLVVQDNTEATLSVGDDVPISTRQAVSVDSADAPFVNSVEYRSTGVILKVKPRINSDQVVSIDVTQEVSRLSEQVDPGLTPIITQRKIESSINVQTGQTVVLGGLIQDTESRGRDQIPILGDIPGLGNLFGGTNNQATRTELIVFIKPQIIKNAEDARGVSEELRSRMRSVSPNKAKSRFQPWKQSSRDQDQEPIAAPLNDQPVDQGSDLAIDQETHLPSSADQQVIPPDEPASAGAVNQSSSGDSDDAATGDAVAMDLAGLDGGGSPLQDDPGDPAYRPVAPVIRPIAGDTPRPSMRPSDWL